MSHEISSISDRSNVKSMKIERSKVQIPLVVTHFTERRTGCRPHRFTSSYAYLLVHGRYVIPSLLNMELTKVMSTPSIKLHKTSKD